MKFLFFLMVHAFFACSASSVINLNRDNILQFIDENDNFLIMLVKSKESADLKDFFKNSEFMKEYAFGLINCQYESICRYLDKGDENRIIIVKGDRGDIISGDLGIPKISEMQLNKSRDEILGEITGYKGFLNRIIEDLNACIISASEKFTYWIIPSRHAVKWSQDSKIIIFSLLAIGFPLLNIFGALYFYLFNRDEE